MANTENLQDLILNEVRREHMPVTLFLMNGFQLKGIVTGFDSFTVILGGTAADDLQARDLHARSPAAGAYRRISARLPCIFEDRV